MAGAGGDEPSLYPPSNGGDFLLQLLRRPPQHQPPPASQPLTHDPAVAAVGPSIPFQPFASGHSRDPPYHRSPPHFAPHNFFSQNPNPNPNTPSPSHHTHQQHNRQFNQHPVGDDSKKLGLYGRNPRPDQANQQDHKNLRFGSLLFENGGPSNGNTMYNERELGLGNRRSNDIDRKPQVNTGAFHNHEQERGLIRPVGPQARRPPPGFPSKLSSVRNRNSGKEKGNFGQLDRRDVGSNDGLSGQLDRPGLPAGSDLLSVSASDIDEALSSLHIEDCENGGDPLGGSRSQDRLDDLDEQGTNSVVLEDGSQEKKDKRQQRDKLMVSEKNKDALAQLPSLKILGFVFFMWERLWHVFTYLVSTCVRGSFSQRLTSATCNQDYRSDKRGQWLMGQRMRIVKRQIGCRRDINRLNGQFLSLYESLIPAEEEKAKQKQLLLLLEKHVAKEWPEARLYLYGSCANSFGFPRSDIDVCLAMEDADVDKSEVLLKLADILQSDNLQNVQALTRARVPIVKLMDPATGISCDICVNNILAVVNTKLLRDYAQIDVRLRQLAFIVKHWAKSRGVNETYHGTLSSYAYVLMCVHFLQQRRPAILPCLQGMENTYAVTVDSTECAYFDQVEKLSGFGSHNRESIGQLVWAFFNYWAYCHDYANDVISVRTGSMLSKHEKDWTRRVGNDRHLICIEDPFELSHDLGRVVDKFSIRVIREEFERAAEILQCDPDPCVMLFKPYVPS
ncbi:hypothetical protein RJ640_014271 [Escallonia rubra]|uniref:RNA uridylyltransferase n=1 Tax=Escallonia rubra TaxID=112253 RepID=A0AA88QMQ4_9ASTE|nr:hypothetical protein RJ640_014271 [Escallonia rubra]